MTPQPLHRQCIQIALKVVGVSAIVMAIIMILQYINLQQFNPESSELLPQLKERLSANSQDAELQQMVRELDLLARRSWFVTQEQLLRGSYLLFGLLGILLAGGIYLNLTAEKEAEKSSRSEDETQSQPMRYAITGLVIALCGTALGLAQFSDMDADSSREVIATAEGEAEAAPTAPLVYASPEALLSQWTQFRGPLQNATIADAQLFTDWDVQEEKNVKWKVEIPLSGFSSPIKWDNQLFLTAGDKNERKIYSYDATTGALLWEHSASDIPNSPAEAPEVTEDTGYAASTPATDGVRVFAAFATGDIVAVDMQGQRVWAKNLGVPHNPYGYASSMVTTEKYLLVQYDDEDKQELYLFDSATGKELWKKTREATISWSTPVIVDQSIIVLATSTTTEGYELATGKQLWTHENMSGEIAVAPFYADGKVFMANDNALAVALDPKTGEVAWETSDFDLPDVSTPLATDGMLVLCTSGGVIEGVDMETGELLWEQELEYGFYNSPLKVGKNILVFDMEGVGYVFEASKEGYKEIGRVNMHEMVVAMPVAEDNKLWIRSRDHLYYLAP